MTSKLPLIKRWERLNKNKILSIFCNVVGIALLLPIIGILLSTGSISKNGNFLFYFFINILAIIIIFIILLLKIIISDIYKSNKDYSVLDILEFFYEYKKEIAVNNIKVLIDKIPEKHKKRIFKNKYLSINEWSENKQYLSESIIINKDKLKKELLKTKWVFLIFIALIILGWAIKSVLFSGFIAISGIILILLISGKDLFKPIL